MTRCCSPLLENTDVRYCPATFATLTSCSSLIPPGKSCSIRPALSEHLCERLIFQEHPLYLLQRFPAVALLGPPQCAHCRGSVRRTAARVLLSGATKLPDESFNIKSFNPAGDRGRRQLRAGLSVDYDQPLEIGRASCRERGEIS